MQAGPNAALGSSSPSTILPKSVVHRRPCNPINLSVLPKLLCTQSTLAPERLEGSLMTVNFRLYRGLEIYPLVFPRQPTLSGHGHNYEDGFDAAVRIKEPEAEDGQSRSCVFRLPAQSGYQSAGDARRACTAYAEQVIDTCPTSRAFFGAQTNHRVRRRSDPAGCNDPSAPAFQTGR